MTTFEILYIFDNGNYTMDNYTIALEDGAGNYYTVVTNRSQSIWSVGEWAIDPDYTDEEPHLGHEIEWHDLPYELQKGLSDYFELDNHSYPILKPVQTEYQRLYDKGGK